MFATKEPIQLAKEAFTHFLHCQQIQQLSMCVYLGQVNVRISKVVYLLSSPIKTLAGEMKLPLVGQ